MYGAIFRNVLFPIYETSLRGRRTLARLAELERSQWRSEQELREQSFRGMIEALRFAEEHVPYYRRRFAEYGVSARKVQAPSDLASFPVLTKAEIRAHGDELVAEGFQGKLYRSGTGGSTGEPVRFAYDHHTYEYRMAAAARADRWAGAELGERELHIWGIPLHKETTFQRIKREAYEAIHRKQMVCAFDLSEARIGEVLDAIETFRPRILVGYATPLYHAARHALAHDRKVPKIHGIVATAERVFHYQRETIECAFGAPVFDRYGCREVMLIAAECDRHQGKHVNAENLFLELYAGDKPAAPGEPGEVLVTDIVCRSMPLIRYKNGDVAVASASSCACGRGLPLLASVEGRVLDMIVGPDGQLLAGEFFPHLLKEYPEIDRFQVHQAKDRSITVKLVPGRGFKADLPALVERRTREYLGERAQIRVEVVPAIPVTQGGKFRVTVSEAAVDLGVGGA